MTIEQIYLDNSISARTMNVCNKNNLKNLEDIFNYFKKNKTFTNLKKCGGKSNFELISVCQKYDVIHKGENIENEIKFRDLNLNQRLILNSFIEVAFNELTPRSKIMLNEFLDKNIKYNNIQCKILNNENFKIHNLCRYGKKSHIEINDFIHSIKKMYYYLESSEDDSLLLSLKNKYLIQNLLKIDNLPECIIETHSIFSLTKHLLENNLIFDKNKTIIFTNGFKIYNNKEILDSQIIADDLELTKERVRQLKKICIEEMKNAFNYIMLYDDPFLYSFKINNGIFIELTDDKINDINKLFKTNFSKEFIEFLLCTYISDNYELVGTTSDVLNNKKIFSKLEHNWKNFYIVKKSVYSKIDFTSFVNSIKLRLSEKIQETYKINFMSFILGFCKINNYNEIYDCKKVMENMLFKEFDIVLDLDDNLVFERNYNYSKINISPVIDVLEEFGEPSFFKDIYSKLNSKIPDVFNSENTLRSILLKNDNFIYFGRNSLFGLKKWEKERDDIKGGTIRSIVYNYLEIKNEPVHIHEIYIEVKKYRCDTNLRSIVTNLKLDKNGLFTFFNQNFLGLKQKLYVSNLTSLPKNLNKEILYLLKDGNNTSIESIIEFVSKKYKISISNSRYIVLSILEKDNSN